MDTAAVTGGTGFVGSHLVRMLCERGKHVRVLVRAESRLDIQNNLPIEPIKGDLREPNSLQPFVEGASELYHVAADYRLWSPDLNELYQSNVQGTENILKAAMQAHVPKVVYTSTVGCLGIPHDGTPGNECTPVTIDDMIGHYKRSKFLAEQVALDYARQGLPIVIVNPSTPVGPGDHKPTPTGKVIVDYLNGNIPAYVDTGLNLIDVRDTALGHILAAENGRIGEKYILGGCNMTLAEILATIASIVGKKPPKVRIPYCIAYVAGVCSTTWANCITHQPPGISIESVRMSKKHMFFSADKAIRELGLPQSSVEKALADAVKWFTEHGYVSGKVSR